jgi:hypothetical protein
MSAHRLLIYWWYDRSPRPGLVEGTGGVALSSAAHCVLVWLTHGMRPACHRGAERLKRGLPSSK